MFSLIFSYINSAFESVCLSLFYKRDHTFQETGIMLYLFQQEKMQFLKRIV